MGKSVTIKFRGHVGELDRQSMPVCSVFAPTGSYIDSDAYVLGVDTDKDATPDTGRSVLASNVGGFGVLEGLRAMADTTTRFAYFERAVMSHIEAKEAGTEDAGVTFDIGDDYKEEIYWVQMADALAGQFDVTVGSASAE